MIKRFMPTETVHNHNKYVLQPIRAEVVEVANGMFELEIDLPKGSTVNRQDIITAPTPRGEQPFRVYRVAKHLGGKRAYARHLFYDLANALLLDTRPTNVNVNSALQSILNAVGWSGWTHLSDITEQRTAYYIRKNPVEAIIGKENSVLNVWGGNLIRDKKEVRIMASGVDRGYEIRLGKNLLGIEDDSDDSNVFTRLYPTYEKDQVIYGIPEQYVDSPLIGSYPTPREKEIRVALTDDQKGYTDAQIHQVLRDYCNNLFVVDNVDKPVANYKVDFVQLAKVARFEQEKKYTYEGLEQLAYETIETLTYEQLEGTTVVQQFIDLLEQVDIHDIVKIRVKELDIDLSAKVISYRYDAIGEKYVSIELGGFKNSNQYQVANIVQQMKNEREKASDEFKELWDMAINTVTGNNGGFKIDRLNADNQPYETLYMDTPDIDTATKVLRINQNGIAGSNNGFNGPYGVAMTLDGYIIGERILVNQLSAITANLGEVTTGVLKSPDDTIRIDLNNKEIRVGSGNQSVNTVLKYNGMEVRDDNVMVAAFGETGAIIPRAEIDEIVNTNIMQKRDGVTTIVGVGGDYSSVAQAMNDMFPNGTKFISGTLIINIISSINEDIIFENFHGGAIEIVINSGVTINGGIEAWNCTCRFAIHGNNPASFPVIKKTPFAINFVNSKYADLYYLNLDNQSGVSAVRCIYGGVVELGEIDIVNASNGIIAENGGTVIYKNCRGNVEYSGYALSGGTIKATGTIPKSSISKWQNNNGFIMENGTPIETDSTYIIPPITSQEFKQVFTGGTFDTLVHGTTNVDSFYGSSAAQNRWDSSMGWKDGRIRVGGEVYNFFNGGSAISVRMRLRRKNSTHGNSGAVYPAPYNHSASFPSGAVRGGWTGWATVPSSLFTSGGATLTYYNGVSGSNGYAIWDAIEIEVTVTKNV